MSFQQPEKTNELKKECLYDLQMWHRPYAKSEILP